MNELRDHDETSAADLLNPAPPVAGFTDPDMAEDVTSMNEDATVSENAAAFDLDREDDAAFDRVSIENRDSADSGIGEALDSGRAAPTASDPQQAYPLFTRDELQRFRMRWHDVQTSFVDEPRAAVETADNLVANVIHRIAEQFASERQDLEKQWDRGQNVNTEDLRQAFKRYRAFFDRLLAV